MLRGLRNFLNMDRSQHHGIDRLKERGVEKGSGRRSTLQGMERSVFNQTNIGTVSRATLGRLLRAGGFLELKPKLKASYTARRCLSPSRKEEEKPHLRS